MSDRCTRFAAMLNFTRIRCLVPTSALALLWIRGTALVAQDPALPVALSLQWGPVWYDRPPGTGGSPMGTRLSGAIGLQLARVWTMGLSATSWARDIAIQRGASSPLSDRDEATLTTLSLRRVCPWRSGDLFVGIGGGVAWTETMRGDVGGISVVRKNRPTLSGSVGTHVSLHRPLWLTVSIEHVRILQTKATSRELRFGTALAVGVSLR